MVCAENQDSEERLMEMDGGDCRGISQLTYSPTVPSWLSRVIGGRRMKFERTMG